MKLLVMCSSYNYPEGLIEMYNSFLETKSEETEIKIYVSEDDPRIEDYKKLDIPIEFGEHKYMVGVMNYFSSKYDAEAYQLICDDHIYLKKGWDVLILEKIKEVGYVSFFDKDDYSNKNPTADVLRFDIVRKLGYFIYPKFRQAYLEPFMQHLARKVGNINLGSDYIEHKCWHGLSKSPKNLRHDFIYGEDENFSINLMAEAIGDVNEKFR